MSTRTGALFPSDFYEEVLTHPLIGGIATIFDVGAMDGDDARRLATLFPMAQVHAFEGLKSNYEKYLKNDPGIKSYNVVLSDHMSSKNFYEKEENGIHSLYERIDLPTKAVHVVETRRLESFMREKNIPVPDLMKLDVEGAALEVLRGMGNTLKHVKALHIETEDFPYFKGQSLHAEVEEYLGRQFIVTVRSKNVVDERGHQYDSIWINIDYI